MDNLYPRIFIDFIYFSCSKVMWRDYNVEKAGDRIVGNGVVCIVVIVVFVGNPQLVSFVIISNIEMCLGKCIE